MEQPKIRVLRTRGVSVSVQLPLGIVEKIDKLAVEQEVSRSDVLRDLIRRGLPFFYPSFAGEKRKERIPK